MFRVRQYGAESWPAILFLSWVAVLFLVPAMLLYGEVGVCKRGSCLNRWVLNSSLKGGPIMIIEYLHRLVYAAHSVYGANVRCNLVPGYMQTAYYFESKCA